MSKGFKSKQDREDLVETNGSGDYEYFESKT